MLTPGGTPHRYPESPVFYRSLTRDYPLAVRGEGCWLEDADGKRYLDAVGGAFVANIGHGVAEIGAAMAAQASRLAYVNGTAFTNEAVEGLAERLVARTPGLGKAYILGSGSEAVEAALKLARQYWIERGAPAKHKIIALAPGYHGNTMLALSASAREHYRAHWREWLVDVHRIPAPYAYRCPCAGVGDCPTCSGAALEAAILEEGSDRVAAFILEPVGGSSTGANVPRDDYLRTVRDICTRHDVLLIADEVLCGAGRTGTWTAIEQWGVRPDLLTLGKGTHAFTLDPMLGEWVLSHPDLRIPQQAREFAINASNSRFWEPAVKRYVDECLAGQSGPRGADFNMRWIASLVAETHRILLRGGVFLYPRDMRDGKKPGRLRVLYETNPIAFLVEQAGGMASTGHGRALEVAPTALHQRIGYVFGSAEEVARIERYHNEEPQDAYASPLFGRRGLFAAPD